MSFYSNVVWWLWALQILQVLVVAIVVVLVIRLLIIKNFPRKQPDTTNAWLGVPLYPVCVSWHAEKGRYLAEVPDLTGCVANGYTPAEALHNAGLATIQWLKTAQELNWPIPTPRTRLRYV